MLKVTITRAQNIDPGLALVTYSASTGGMWRVAEPGVYGGAGHLVSSVGGQAIVGTDVALMAGASRPPGYTEDELRFAVRSAEHERRATINECPPSS